LLSPALEVWCLADIRKIELAQHALPTQRQRGAQSGISLKMLVRSMKTVARASQNAKIEQSEPLYIFNYALVHERV
jgi:hypothetical protein